MLSLLFQLLAVVPAAALFPSGSIPVGPDVSNGRNVWVSADGAHFAQLVRGEKGDEWHLDGRRVARDRVGTFFHHEEKIQAVVGSGGRLAYTRRVYGRDGAPAGEAVVFAGRQGPVVSAVFALAASPDGAHVAYIAAAARGCEVFVDGKKVGTNAECNKEVSVDDQGRAVYLTVREDGARWIAVNGTAVLPWRAETLVLGPGGKGKAGWFKRNGRYFVAVGDKTDYGPYNHVSDVAFAADGRSVFFEALADAGAGVFLNGGLHGPSGTDPLKSAAFMAPARLAYFAKEPEGERLYVDGKGTVLFTRPLAVGAAANGEHHAAVGFVGDELVWAADGRRADGPPSILAGARVVFDGSDEFHVLTTKGGTVHLTCLAFTRERAQASACMKDAKRRYQTGKTARR